MACGVTMGHGERCVEGWECDRCTREALLKEQLRRLMEVSQHSLADKKYLAEVGLYREIVPNEYEKN